MMIKWKSGSRTAVIAMAALMPGGMMASPLWARADAGSPAATIYAAGQDTPTHADGSDKDGKKVGKGAKGGSEPIIISPPIIVKDPPKKKS